MVRIVKETNAFRRDVRRTERRNKDLAKLFSIVERLATDQPLEARNRPHALTGDWRPCWECHIEPDWLLVYIVHKDHVELIRTGTHSDLF